MRNQQIVVAKKMTRAEKLRAQIKELEEKNAAREREKAEKIKKATQEKAGKGSPKRDLSRLLRSISRAPRALPAPTKSSSEFGPPLILVKPKPIRKKLRPLKQQPSKHSKNIKYSHEIPRARPIVNSSVESRVEKDELPESPSETSLSAIKRNVIDFSALPAKLKSLLPPILINKDAPAIVAQKAPPLILMMSTATNVQVDLPIATSLPNSHEVKPSIRLTDLSSFGEPPGSPVNFSSASAEGVDCNIIADTAMSSPKKQKMRQRKKVFKVKGIENLSTGQNAAPFGSDGVNWDNVFLENDDVEDVLDKIEARANFWGESNFEINTGWSVDEDVYSLPLSAREYSLSVSSSRATSKRSQRSSRRSSRPSSRQQLAGGAAATAGDPLLFSLGGSVVTKVKSSSPGIIPFISEEGLVRTSAAGQILHNCDDHGANSMILAGLTPSPRKGAQPQRKPRIVRSTIA